MSGTNTPWGGGILCTTLVVHAWLNYHTFPLSVNSFQRECLTHLSLCPVLCKPSNGLILSHSSIPLTWGLVYWLSSISMCWPEFPRHRNDVKLLKRLCIHWEEPTWSTLTRGSASHTSTICSSTDTTMWSLQTNFFFYFLHSAALLLLSSSQS